MAKQGMNRRGNRFPHGGHQGDCPVPGRVDRDCGPCAASTTRNQCDDPRQGPQDGRDDGIPPQPGCQIPQVPAALRISVQLPREIASFFDQVRDGITEAAGPFGPPFIFNSDLQAVGRRRPRTFRRSSCRRDARNDHLPGRSRAIQAPHPQRRSPQYSGGLRGDRRARYGAPDRRLRVPAVPAAPSPENSWRGLFGGPAHSP